MTSAFKSGDQDYDSVIGWDPQKENREKLIAESKKKYPRLYSEQPEMLYVQSIQEFITSGAKSGPMKQLFGPLWLEEEVAVLYSPPGTGKSALAVQIGESLARGIPLAPFDKPVPGLEVAAQHVLYLDFELTRVQFSQRYTVTAADGASLGDTYQFSPNFLRAELYWDGKMIDGYEDFTDMIFEDIYQRICEHNATVLIVDNITFLSRSSTANASIAFRLMNRLQELKKTLFISVLVVAHTPKHPAHKPITMNHLQGSIDLAKVADSMFVLGRSSMKDDLRYLKHVKSRTGVIEHGEDNAAVYRLAKFDLAERLGCTVGTARAANFLGFDFVGFDAETEHLAERPNSSIGSKQRVRRSDRRLVAYAKVLAGQGLSSAAIAERLGVGKSTANRYVKIKESASIGGVPVAEARA
ncbi:MAG: AAA family ATPase [Pyrinomonadaceae bacterium]